MTSCPACDKPVDPLRSRFVSVRDGKVVAYCSAECAAGEGPAVAGRAGAPAAAVPTRIATIATTATATTAGGPVRAQTPAPGVPILLGGRSEAAPPVEGSGPVIEILHEPVSGGAAPARDAEAGGAARHPEAKPEAAVTAPVARSVTTPTSTVGREATTPSPAVAEARREAPARAPTDVDLEPAPRRSRLPILLLVLVLVGGGGFLLYRYLVHGGLAAAPRPPSAPPAGSAHLGSARSVRAPGPAAAAAAPRAPEAAAPVDVAAAVERAREALRGELAATSPRVQRLAAAALARTQDPAACTLLAAQIGVGGDRAPAPRAGAQADEPRTNDIARLALAYALARGGDRRGSDVLAGALGAPRGEARDEAARLLALLGDRRAVPHLLDLLAVSRRRLGAAEHLAYLREPHAVKVLDQMRADPRASADDKARATVALGIAGRDDVAAALRDMLGDPHFNAFAASALAELKDRSARPVLERQLASPPLRVPAARALRRLEPAIEAGPLLVPLLDVVRAGRDIDRIPAAEAILILAGPERWSAYD